MPKVISRSAVALATFVIGISISNLTSFKPSLEPYRAVAQPNYVLSERHAEAPANPTPLRFLTDPALLVVVRINSKPPLFRRRSVALTKDQPTIVNLDLDEDIESVEMILNSTDNFARYRIFQRYRTSMSISEKVLTSIWSTGDTLIPPGYRYASSVGVDFER